MAKVSILIASFAIWASPIIAQETLSTSISPLESSWAVQIGYAGYAVYNSKTSTLSEEPSTATAGQLSTASDFAVQIGYAGYVAYNSQSQTESVPTTFETITSSALPNTSTEASSIAIQLFYLGYLGYNSVASGTETPETTTSTISSVADPNVTSRAPGYPEYVGYKIYPQVTMTESSSSSSKTAAASDSRAKIYKSYRKNRRAVEKAEAV